MVREGRTDEEIKSLFVTEYSKRILALPEGAERVWLFWTPWLVSTVALTGLSFFVYRLSLQRRPSVLSGLPAAALEDGWDLDS
jgi:cytochrome c-type biogenesis protein CcmH/NrfF